MSFEIKPVTVDNFEMVWPIFESVVRAGTTYSYPPDLTFEQSRDIWCAEEKTPYMAINDGEVVGTFYIRANQLGLGDHVANGGFMVAPGQCGKGYGTKMGQAMVDEAKRMGYHGMQFNFIVQGNERSLRIWDKLGFDIVGTVPDAFRHAEKGLTPVHILYKKL